MPRYIDADALTENLLSYADANKGTYHAEGFKNAITVVEDQPTVDVVERTRGKWIYREAYKGSRFGFLECSCCGEVVWLRKDEPDKFCRNCGAEMEADDAVF